MSAVNDGPRELATEQQDRLEGTIRRFEDAWQKGLRPALAEYLPSAPDERRALLVELIHIDLEYRLKAGESARVEPYLQAYPELAADRAVALAMIAREYELRGRRESGLTVEEYARRFPQYRADLPARLKAPGPTPPSAVVEETVVEGRPASSPAAPAPAGTPIGSTAALVQALRSVRLLRGNQEDELDTLQQSFPDPRGLARELMQRNWLTPYQINQVFQGRQGGLVLGPYLLVERIGEGGMGAVYKARHQLMDRVVALKVIRKARLGDDEAVRRFHREIRAAAQLQHPNIVMAYDADHVGDVHFLVMEFVEGTDLSKVLRKQGPLPVAQACAYIRQAFLGLEHAHEKGMVHRDLKPGNLLLSKAGVVKILDMGLARLSQVGEQTLGGELTQEGSVMGTPDYIAPEQAQESHTVDIRADIYSLGCALYHLLTGQVPFPGGTLAQKLVKHMSQPPAPVELIRPGLPAGLGDVVRRLMAKKPEDRYQTPAEAAAALEPFCRELPPGAIVNPVVAPADDSTLTFLPTRAAPTPVSLRSLWTNRRVRRILFGGAGALLLLVAVLWLLRPAPRERSHPLDRLAQENIPAGDRFDWQPAGLVAILGEHRVRARDGGAFSRVAVSPDGKLGAAAGNDGLIHLFDTETLRERSALGSVKDQVYALAFSPDGKLLASGHGDSGAVLLWDVKARKLHKACEGHTGPVSSLAFFPDGKRLVSASHDNTVRLWSAETGKQLKISDPAQCVAVAPEGGPIYSGGGEIDPTGKPVNCDLRSWDMQLKAGDWYFGFKQPITNLALSKDGSRLLFGSHDGARVWEPGAKLKPKLLANGSAKFVALSPDGSRALTCSDNSNIPVQLWDVVSGRNLRSFPASMSPGFVFLPDNRRALIVSDNTVRLWDTEDNRELRPPVGHTRAVTTLAFSQDGRSLVSGSEDTTARLWDLAEVRELHVLRGHFQPLTSVALSADGQYVLSCTAGAGSDKTPRLWDAGSGRELRQFDRAAVYGVYAVAFAPDELQALAPAAPIKDKKDSEYGFALWDVEDGKQLRRFDGHKNVVFQLGYFADGQRAFSASHAGTVRLWEVETGKQLEKFAWGATQVGFNEDGSRAYTGHGDGTIQRWNLTESPPKPFAFQRWHEGGVNALALSPDGTLLASAAADGRVIVWDLNKSQKVGVWPPFGEKARVWPQPDRINALAFAPDGRHLALGSNNGTVYIVRLDARGKGLEQRRVGGQ